MYSFLYHPVSILIKVVLILIKITLCMKYLLVFLIEILIPNIVSDLYGDPHLKSYLLLCILFSNWVTATGLSNLSDPIRM